MKQLYILSILSLCLVNFSFGNILQVNNHNPAPGHFTTIVSAVNAATDGDTIYLYPSPINYGAVTINKRLTIIGPGFGPASATPFTAQLGNITLGTAVDPISGVATSADGSIFKSMRIPGFILASGYQPDSLYFERVWFTHATAALQIRGSHFTFVGCIFNSPITINAMFSNANFYNCIFNSASTVFNITGAHTIADATIKNCLFLGRGTPGLRDVKSSAGSTIGLTYTNNIFVFYNPAPGCGSCFFFNNMSFGAGVPNLNNHGLISEDNFIATELGLINFEPFTTFNELVDVNLQTTSPAVGAGLNNEDLGVKGGNPGYFVQRGEPKLPRFQILQLFNPVVNKGDDVKIRIRANMNTN